MEIIKNIFMWIGIVNTAMIFALIIWMWAHMR